MMKHFLIFICLLLNGIVLSGQENLDAENQIYTIVDSMPNFGDNEDVLQEYIQANSKLRTSTHRTETCSPVFVYVIIEKDGTATFNGIARGDGAKRNKAARHVIQKMPKWHPGSSRGDPKRVSYIIPFWFEE